MIERGYMFLLSYANRIQEKEFIKSILRRYDTNKLVGAGIYVNNNPYNLQLLLHLNFDGETTDFEEWLAINYPEKQRKINYFHSDIFESISTKGYNFATFVDEDTVDLAITREANPIFLFPDKEMMSTLWNNDILRNDLSVFLSHSSRDKEIVDEIFSELQINEIRAWYDKYEIRPGDSIVDKINDGLENSDIGIICISRNFLNSSTGWTKNELNYFIQRRMRSGKNDFICLNFDLNHDELPPLVQDYRYIDMRDDKAVSVLIQTLKERAKTLDKYARSNNQ